MRRKERSASFEVARELFSQASYVSLASLTPDGAPVLRTLNVVVVPQAEGFSLAFHGAPQGEKLACIGQRAVLGCERQVASIPSWFTSAERACPATTWYVSAQAHGTLVAVDDERERAQVLHALMARFQPEGRHRAITAGDPMYAAALRGLLIAKLTPDAVTAKVSVGQDKPPEVRLRVLRGLWERGDPGDIGAIHTSLSFAPDPWPAWLEGPAGTRLHPGLGPHDHAPVRSLLRQAEWNGVFTDAQLARALRDSAAFVMATVEGQPVGTARAVTDGGKFAYIADVFVREDWRGRGLGDALVRLLLDHPAVRGVPRLLLRTRIAEGFWSRFGFETFVTLEGRPWMWRQEARRVTDSPGTPDQAPRS